VAIARSKFEVREAVIGTRIACNVSMNQRQRSRPLSVAGNRHCNSVASAGKIGIECGLV
jgi:hypothetical protein